MDKIWYINPSKSEVIGRCGGYEKTEWSRRTDKRLKTHNKNTPCQRVPKRAFTCHVIQFNWVISYTQTLHYGQITRIASNVFIISFSYKIFLKWLTKTNMYVCWLIPIPVSTIVKQAILLMALHSNTFLEPTSSDKYGYTFLFKEIMGMFGGIRTQAGQASTDDELTTSPRRPYVRARPRVYFICRY